MAVKLVVQKVLTVCVVIAIKQMTVVEKLEWYKEKENERRKGKQKKQVIKEEIKEKEQKNIQQ